MSEEREWGRVCIFMGHMRWIRPARPYTPTPLLLCTAPAPRCSEGPFPSGFQLGLTNGRCLEKALAPHSFAWKIAWTGVAKSQTWLSDFTFTFHFRALEKEMATHSRVPAWRIPGTEEPGGLPSMGLHRVGHDWSDLAAAGAWRVRADHSESFHVLITSRWLSSSFHLRWHLLPRGSLPTATWLSGHLLPLPSPFRPGVIMAPHSFQPWCCTPVI